MHFKPYPSQVRVLWMVGRCDRDEVSHGFAGEFRHASGVVHDPLRGLSQPCFTDLPAIP